MRNRKRRKRRRQNPVVGKFVCAEKEDAKTCGFQREYGVCAMFRRDPNWLLTPIAENMRFSKGNSANVRK
jgi:hypothetical protein